MSIAVFQFKGCQKCFSETLLLDIIEGNSKWKTDKIERFENPANWEPSSLDVAIITGYLETDDLATFKNIQKNAHKVIAYGSCAVTGGIFGLAYQKGTNILSIAKEFPDVVQVHGCLGEIEELVEVLSDQEFSKIKALCNICERQSECMYLDEIHRQIDVMEDEEQCFNDMGLLCNGYVARECKEMCVNAGAPCRGCKPAIDRPGFRMIGMFGTFMGEIEVATEANKYGATDKLADRDDEITKSLPDVAGNFFRYDLANSMLPIGRQTSSGNILSDVYTNRLIEELPLIAGSIGGLNSIGLTLDIIEAYENGTTNSDEPIVASEATKELRTKLRTLQDSLKNAVKDNNAAEYKTITMEIRRLAGNMNLSRLGFGGFRTPIPDQEDFSEYQSAIFQPLAGDYSYGQVKYSLDAMGKVLKFEQEME